MRIGMQCVTGPFGVSDQAAHWPRSLLFDDSAPLWVVRNRAWGIRPKADLISASY